MAFCKQCGQPLDQGASFCPNCGTPTAQQPVQGQQPPQYGQQPPQYGQQPPQYGQQPPQYGQQPPQYGQQPPQYGQQPPQYGQQQYYQPYGDPDIQSSKGMAWLAYFGMFFLVPMFAKRESPFCQYHVKQGATLFCIDILYWIVRSVILAIIGAIFPGRFNYYTYVNSGVYTLFNVIFSVGTIFLFVLAIIGIVNAAGGKYKELPVIGKITFISKLLDKFYNNTNP